MMTTGYSFVNADNPYKRTFGFPAEAFVSTQCPITYYEVVAVSIASGVAITDTASCVAKIPKGDISNYVGYTSLCQGVDVVSQIPYEVNTFKIKAFATGIFHDRITTGLLTVDHLISKESDTITITTVYGGDSGNTPTYQTAPALHDKQQYLVGTNVIGFILP